MAIGDIKDDDVISIEVTAGAAVTKGQVVHLESDGKWDPVADNDTGKFGVANTAADADGDSFMCIIYGKTEVTATAAAIAKGAYVIAGSTGLVKDAGTISETTVMGTIVGTTLEAFGSGGSQVIFVGMI